MDDDDPSIAQTVNEPRLKVDTADLLRSLPQATVPTARLLPGNSPRARPENRDHVRALAESVADLGPILVHRPTMRVIDGMHRLRAAACRGEREVTVRYFDGNEADAFVLAVRLNVQHGLPLTLAERRNAAARIVRSHPHWSDRAIAHCAGLSPKTVGKLRMRASEEIPHLNTRMGRDGRMRSVNSAEGRRRAALHLAAGQELSLRELAGKVELSVNTVRDVRDRLRRGEDPVPEPRRRVSSLARTPEIEVADVRDNARGAAAAAGPGWPAASPQSRTHEPGADTGSLLRKLARDPALRGTESGRLLLRMLAMTELEREQWRAIIENIPAHCAPLVRTIAVKRAEEWRQFADLNRLL